MIGQDEQNQLSSLNVGKIVYHKFIDEFEREDDSDTLSNKMSKIERFESRYKLLQRTCPYKFGLILQKFEKTSYIKPLEDYKVLVVLYKILPTAFYDKESMTINLRIPEFVDVLGPEIMNFNLAELSSEVGTPQSAASAKPNTFSECKHIKIYGNSKSLMGQLKGIQGWYIVYGKEQETIRSSQVQHIYYRDLLDIDFIDFDGSRISDITNNFFNNDNLASVAYHKIGITKLTVATKLDIVKHYDKELDTSKIEYSQKIDRLDGLYDRYNTGNNEIIDADLSDFKRCCISQIVNTFQGNNVRRIYGINGDQFNPEGVECKQAFYLNEQIQNFPEFIYQIKILNPKGMAHGCQSLSLQDWQLTQLNMQGDLSDQFSQAKLPRQLNLDFTQDDRSGLNRFEFEDDPELGKLRVVRWQSLKGLFKYSSNLRDINISGLKIIVHADDVSRVWNRGPDILRALDLSEMFSGCSSIRNVTFKNIKVVKEYGDSSDSVELITSNMFCNSSVENVVFEHIDLSECDLSLSKTLSHAGCLKTLIMRDIKVKKLTQLNDIVTGTPKDCKIDIQEIEVQIQDNKNTNYMFQDIIKEEDLIKLSINNMQNSNVGLKHLPDLGNTLIMTGMIGTDKQCEQALRLMRYMRDYVKFDFEIIKQDGLYKGTFDVYIKYYQHDKQVSQASVVNVNVKNVEHEIKTNKTCIYARALKKQFSHLDQLETFRDFCKDYQSWTS